LIENARRPPAGMRVISAASARVSARRSWARSRAMASMPAAAASAARGEDAVVAHHARERGRGAGGQVGAHVVRQRAGLDVGQQGPRALRTARRS
jgi:hypothetical protein